MASSSKVYQLGKHSFKTDEEKFEIEVTRVSRQTSLALTLYNIDAGEKRKRSVTQIDGIYREGRIIKPKHVSFIVWNDSQFFLQMKNYEWCGIYCGLLFGSIVGNKIRINRLDNKDLVSYFRLLPTNEVLVFTRNCNRRLHLPGRQNPWPNYFNLNDKDCLPQFPPLVSIEEPIEWETTSSKEEIVFKKGDGNIIRAISHRCQDYRDATQPYYQLPTLVPSPHLVHMLSNTIHLAQPYLPSELCHEVAKYLDPALARLAENEELKPELAKPAIRPLVSDDKEIAAIVDKIEDEKNNPKNSKAFRLACSKLYILLSSEHARYLTLQNIVHEIEKEFPQYGTSAKPRSGYNPSLFRYSEFTAEYNKLRDILDSLSLLDKVSIPQLVSMPRPGKCTIM